MRTRLRAGAVAVLLLLLPAAATAAAARPMRFDRLSVEQGLSQSTVLCVFQDSRGFIWLGTEDGLNRFDGYSFTIYRHDPRDPESLPADFVWSIVEDAAGDLWIATEGGGLTRWERDRDRFVHRGTESTAGVGLPSDQLRELLIDDAGALWIGTRDAGLVRLDPKDGSSQHYPHDDSDPSSLIDDGVYALQIDRNGNLWVGTNGGLDRFDAATGGFHHHPLDRASPGSLEERQVRAILEDRQGTLWVGTYGGGLSALHSRGERIERFSHDPRDPASLADDFVHALLEDDAGRLWVGTRSGLQLRDQDGFVRYQHDPLDPHSLGHDEVMSLLQDRGGVLWAGTRAGGVAKWNPATWSFGHVSARAGDPTGLNENYVTSFSEDAAGHVWIGTLGGGLNVLNRSTGSMRHYAKSRSGLSDDRVMSLLHDQNGSLWVGTMQGGLNRMRRGDDRFEVYSSDPTRQGSLSAPGIMSLFEDSHGTLWVGTYGGGLNRKESGSDAFVSYRHDPAAPSSLSSDIVTAIAEDASGALWVGTEGGGLNRLDRETGTFARFRNDPERGTSLSDDTVYSLYVAPDDTLWVGMRGGLDTLVQLDADSGEASFRAYTASDGLPNDVIYGIEPDGAGRLWMSTNQGLVRFDPRTESFKDFSRSHGLQDDEFNFGAHYRSPRGELFFGGPSGFNAFLPERLQVNSHAPPVTLTAFLKSNKAVPGAGPAWALDQLTLGYRDQVVTFEFAALDFAAPERNRYLYMLEGFDEDWVDLGAVRRVTYTNLDAGDYTLRVKGANNDGVWSDQGLTLPLQVIPAPWRTWWANTLYVLLLAGAVLGVLRTQQRKLEREARYRRRLEREVETRTEELARQNGQLETLNNQLVETSLTDSLTGMRNRRYLFEEVGKQMTVLRRERLQSSGDAGQLIFLMVDLDWFKPINDTCGHAAGDRVLVQIREILEKACRSSDVLIRWGGDEFLVVGRAHDLMDVEVLPERIRSMVEEHAFDVGDGQVAHLTCSIGFTCYPSTTPEMLKLSLSQVVKLADRALYTAKSAGRNAWVGLLGKDDTDVDTMARWIDAEPDALLDSGCFDIRQAATEETVVAV